MRDQIEAAGYAAGWRVVRALPQPVARRSFRALADQAWRRRGRGVQQLERNLARVAPERTAAELRELSRLGMRSYLRYWMEVFRLPDLPREVIVSTLRAEREHLLRDPLAAGRGVVVSLPHTANWDHSGAWATLSVAPLTTVAERLRPESVYERFLRYRRSLGMEVLPLTGGAGPFPVLVERAAGGGLVALLGDRDLTRAGVPVTFFGERTKMPAGPAAVALESGAHLLPATLWYDADSTWVRFHPYVEPPATGSRQEKIAAMTQAVAAVFEAEIRQHPEDWHMLQPLWQADLNPARQARQDTS